MLAAETLENDVALPGKDWVRMQNPQRILLLVQQAIDTLLKRFPQTQRIGVTGQQHGNVYLDEAGNPVSPLYTWQDQRGCQPTIDGGTYTGQLQLLTGDSVPKSTGFKLLDNSKKGRAVLNCAALYNLQMFLRITLDGTHSV